MTKAPSLPRRYLAPWLGLAALTGCGCALAGNDGAESSASLAYRVDGGNQVVAWVPQSRATTATVAQAIAHIALADAKRATEAELCNGTWMLSGRLHQDQAPELSLAPETLGGNRGWHVRISWNPQLDECGLSAHSYALTLSRHLPAWMMTLSAQPLALYHQGNQLQTGQSLSQVALAATP